VPPEALQRFASGKIVGCSHKVPSVLWITKQQQGVLQQPHLVEWQQTGVSCTITNSAIASLCVQAR
jgi:hypothetical protein